MMKNKILCVISGLFINFSMQAQQPAEQVSQNNSKTVIGNPSTYAQQGRNDGTAWSVAALSGGFSKYKAILIRATQLESADVTDYLNGVRSGLLPLELHPSTFPQLSADKTGSSQSSDLYIEGKTAGKAWRDASLPAATRQGVRVEYTLVVLTHAERQQDIQDYMDGVDGISGLFEFPWNYYPYYQ